MVVFNSGFPYGRPSMLSLAGWAPDHGVMGVQLEPLHGSALADFLPIASSRSNYNKSPRRPR